MNNARNRDTKGQYKANMSDRERSSPSDLASRRAAISELSRQATIDSEAAGAKLAQQMSQSLPVEVKRVDTMSAHEKRMELWRQRSAEVTK